MIKELVHLNEMIEKSIFYKELIDFKPLSEVNFKNNTYPIYSYTIGSPNPEAPVLFITGGIHGLEQIGAQLAWSLLKTTIDRLQWDKSIQQHFQNIRLVCIPLVNPVGYFNNTRSNGNGVDLMRNSPIRAVEKTNFLVSGQSYSAKWPWYHGKINQLETENENLKNEFLQQTNKSKCVISIDFHSGFGLKDRLWFPFSYTKNPFPHLAEMYALKHLFEQSHPYHIYKIEPQANSYLINGDIWDYLYLEFKKTNPNSCYIPLTLEMGSWNWVKKNPFQIFLKNGIFNPILDHRIKRTYRRHYLLYDFLLKAIYSNSLWSKLNSIEIDKNKLLAIDHWYSKNEK